MALPKPENRLRSYRRRSGLTQRELAYLLGQQKESQVSRYESRKILPSLETALGCEAIFGVPVAELFPGSYEDMAGCVKRRARIIAAALQAKQTRCDKRVVAQRLQWLVDHCAVTRPEHDSHHEEIAA
jgi:transcriptional regulator with XRE-family HTH domain